jgi:hypothetical protein
MTSLACIYNRYTFVTSYQEFDENPNCEYMDGNVQISQLLNFQKKKDVFDVLG